MLASLKSALERPVDGASLAAFRFVFAILLFIGTLRLLAKGYVHEAFGVPRMFFAPWPFSEVLRPLPEGGMLALYVVLAAAQLSLAVGFLTRASAALACLLFTYAHFVDLTNYLNHYWLVTLLTGLMAWLPVARTLSVDAWLWPATRAEDVPAYALYTFRFQVGVVYFFAGFAKLGSDWLLRAEPLRTWLLANTDTPLLGPLFREPWVAYAMSWGGAFYDLSIAGWLLLRRARPFAYAAVVMFHLLTSWLFHIGMFPLFMTAASLLFLDPDWPRRISRRIPSLARSVTRSEAAPGPRRVPRLLLLYAVLQVIIPLRFLLYGGNVLWHEQGYRFAWRVMLMEKMGVAEFSTIERRTGTRRSIRVRDSLTLAQEKAMSTQPDLILAFARHLAREEKRAGRDVEVHADVFVTLNGRPARRLLDPSIDLARERDGFTRKTWILPAP